MSYSSSFVEFDSFNRTVASGWGTSSSGIPWVHGDSMNVQLSVDGSCAKAVFPQSTIGLAPYKNLYVTSGPWQESSFTLTTKFELTLASEVDLYGFTAENSLSGDFIGLYAAPFINQLFIDTMVGTHHGSFAVDFTFSDGWYFLKWEVTASMTKGKVWAEGSVEPDWMVSAASDSLVPDALYVGLQGGWHASGGSAMVRIEGIDFCGTTQPGISPAVSVVIDDFNDRTIAWNSTNPSAIGSTSGTHHAWYNPVSGGDNTISEYAVECGAGKVRLPAATPGSTSTILTLNQGGSDYWPWQLTGVGVPNQLFGEALVDYAIDVSISNTSRAYLEIALADNIATDVGGVFVYIDPWGGSIGFDSYDAPSVFRSFSWVAGTWYTVRVKINGTNASLKVWDRNTTEPSSWLSSLATSANSTWTPGEFTMMFINSTGGSELTFGIDNFVILSTGVYAPSTPEVPGDSTETVGMGPRATGKVR